MEGLGYAFGAIAFPAASIGAPHIRDRTYWAAVRMGNADNARPQGYAWNGGATRWEGSGGPIAKTSVFGGLADSNSSGQQQFTGITEHAILLNSAHDKAECVSESGDVRTSSIARTGPTNGHWCDADWLGCRDGKWRPVEPGTFPLVDGISNRVGRLRAYGNAIVPQQAAEFIKACL